MGNREPWAPDCFPPGVEPDWVVGYEMTEDGWKPMDADREAAFIQEGIDSLERDGGIPHDQVMAELRAHIAAKQSAPAK